MKVNETPYKDYRRSYTESDVEVLFRRGDWRNWDDALNWLKEYGEADNELTPGEVIAMKEDLEQIAKKGEKFTTDAARVCSMARACRSGDE